MVSLEFGWEADRAEPWIRGSTLRNGDWVSFGKVAKVFLDVDVDEWSDFDITGCNVDYVRDIHMVKTAFDPGVSVQRFGIVPRVIAFAVNLETVGAFRDRTIVAFCAASAFFGNGNRRNPEVRV